MESGENSEKSSKENKHHHKQYLEHKTHKNYKKYEMATWILGGISAVLLIIVLVLLSSGGINKGVSKEEIKQKTQTYLEQLLPGQTVSVDSIEDKGDIYSLKLTVAGRQYDSYATKDGKLLFPSAIDMSEKPVTDNAQQPQQTNVPKSDKPQVELFVMSHCPFGTQAEKGILPAIRTLGDKVDFKVRFVYYAMHGEKEVKEQLTQYCIQKNEPEKYLKYLACFLNDSAGQGSLEASNKCITDLEINKNTLEKCKTDADKQFEITKNLNDQSSWLSGRFPLFNTDKEANQKYGVAGSPTLVINGVTVNSGRDSASFLAAICNAFNEKPEECDTQLSSTTPGPGFGYDSTAAATAAGCGV
ncbi:MAG: thioredoxin domain-containing protein [Candidatus Woesearchaeota archaeon]